MRSRVDELEEEVAALNAANEQVWGTRRRLSRDFQIRNASKRSCGARRAGAEIEALIALRDGAGTLGEEALILDDAEENLIAARAETALLNDQLQALNDQIAELNALLETYEARNAAQQAQIVDLGRRLNVALASQVQELARYRSEFFGRLREVLATGTTSDCWRPLRLPVGGAVRSRSGAAAPAGRVQLAPQNLRMRCWRFPRASRRKSIGSCR